MYRKPGVVSIEVIVIAKDLRALACIQNYVARNLSEFSIAG